MMIMIMQRDAKLHLKPPYPLRSPLPDATPPNTNQPWCTTKQTFGDAVHEIEEHLVVFLELLHFDGVREDHVKIEGHIADLLRER